MRHNSFLKSLFLHCLSNSCPSEKSGSCKNPLLSYNASVILSYPIAAPTGQPSRQPTVQPTRQPSVQPSRQPSGQPSRAPTIMLSKSPTRAPTPYPTANPTHATRPPSPAPLRQPTRQPTGQPTGQPTVRPTGQPSYQPTGQPTIQPSRQPTTQPTSPTGQPTRQPTRQPTNQPSSRPTKPTGQPTARPTRLAQGKRGGFTVFPTGQPSRQPTGKPSRQPTSAPSASLKISFKLDFSLSGVSPSQEHELKQPIRRSVAATLKLNYMCVGTPVFRYASSAAAEQEVSSLLRARLLQSNGGVSVSVPIAGQSDTLFNTSIPGAPLASSALQAYSSLMQVLAPSNSVSFVSSLGQQIVASNPTAFANVAVTGVNYVIYNNSNFQPTPPPSPAPSANPTALPTFDQTIISASTYQQAGTSNVSLIIGVAVSGGVLVLATLAFLSHKQAIKKARILPQRIVETNDLGSKDIPVTHPRPRVMQVLLSSMTTSPSRIAPFAPEVMARISPAEMHLTGLTSVASFSPLDHTSESVEQASEKRELVEPEFDKQLSLEQASSEKASSMEQESTEQDYLEQAPLVQATTTEVSASENRPASTTNS